MVRLLVGIISAPFNFDRRAWIRTHVRHHEQHRFAFVIGTLSVSYRTDLQLLVDAEARDFGDIVRVNASDGMRTSNVLKTFAWWRHAIELGDEFDYIAKTDDDTLYSSRRVLNDLSAAPRRERAYYGAMRWRLFSGKDRDVCQPFVPNSLGQRALVRAHRKECADPIGPFLYADGVFEALSVSLARDLVKGGAFANASLLSPSSRAEDPFLGMVLYERFARRGAPRVFYLSLRPGKHLRFWYDMRDRKRNDFRHTRFVHRVYNSMLAHKIARGMNRSLDAPLQWSCRPCSQYGADDADGSRCCRPRAVGQS